MSTSRVGPFRDFLSALIQVRPEVPNLSALRSLHCCVNDTRFSIDDASNFLYEENYQSMKYSGKLLLLALKRAIPSQSVCEWCNRNGVKCQSCLAMHAHLKSVSTGLLSIEAVREFNSRYMYDIIPFAQEYRKVFIVDVANMLQSRSLPSIFDRLVEHHNGEHLSYIRSHIQDGCPKTTPNDRIRFLQFFIAYMEMINSLLGYTAGFIFVNQCNVIQNLGCQNGLHYKWINVSFTIQGERMHTITGFDGSDDALMVEIHRRLRDRKIEASIVSEDRFSEYKHCYFYPTSATPLQLSQPQVRPQRRPRDSDVEAYSPLARRLPHPQLSSLVIRQNS